MTFAESLPIIFMALMGLSMLAYVVLDGYDLGVGMLMHRATDEQKDVMIASIGPFWDANETWLVLGIGLLLIVFPKAHSMILQALYLPVSLMLIGLILRGAAFDFRTKAHAHHKSKWNTAFMVGSGLASAAQGWMLGRYVTGLNPGWEFNLFAAAIAVTLSATYVLIGACWLIFKTENELQLHAVRWAKIAWPPVVLGMVLISVATPWVSETVRERWFTLPALIALIPIPLMTGLSFIALRVMLNSKKILGDWSWLPFALVVWVFILGFFGLAYSLYPYVVLDRLTIFQSASSTDSLIVILIGTMISVPAIIFYTIFSYRVFSGKATTLRYA
jgi:cytochrome bd ubiquinol oxidase subunit II